VAVVVGSGIFAQRLSPGGDGLQLLAAQVVGAATAVALARFLHPDLPAEEVVMPHPEEERS
jgi:hypothetical protein